MFRKRFVCLVATLACLGAAVPGIAAEVDSDSVYCFSSGDFSENAPELEGVCIMELPDPETGTVMLGTRVVQPGDILTSGQLAQMTFNPVHTEEDAAATVGYLPIYGDRVEQTACMTISIRGKENKAPVAKNVAMETYKNIPNDGRLKASDPEGEKLTFTVTRQPRRGDVVVQDDGTFTYTPKKNKVGVDSFTYTATDPAGKVSKEATVTIEILKPSDAPRYQDTAGLDCRFEAEWLRQTGLFEGEKVGGANCFQPEKTVTQGQFLAMLVETLGIAAENGGNTELANQAPQWLRPYVLAAQRSGLLAGVEQFAADEAINGRMAATLLQNGLDLAVTETMAGEAEADLALTVMNENGFALDAERLLTRADAANILYKVSITDAPGKAVYKQ